MVGAAVIPVHETGGIYFQFSRPRPIGGNRETFENTLKEHGACVGTVTQKKDFIINGLDGKALIHSSVQDLKAAWKKPFGDLQ